MFDVLMYLFETYIHNETELRVDQDALTDDLTRAGFDRADIYSALNWLERLADLQEGKEVPFALASDPHAAHLYAGRGAALRHRVPGLFVVPGANQRIES